LRESFKKQHPTMPKRSKNLREKRSLKVLQTQNQLESVLRKFQAFKIRMHQINAAMGRLAYFFYGVHSVSRKA
jgi:hypothetical protein